LVTVINFSAGSDFEVIPKIDGNAAAALSAGVAWVSWKASSNCAASSASNTVVGVAVPGSPVMADMSICSVSSATEDKMSSAEPFLPIVGSGSALNSS